MTRVQDLWDRQRIHACLLRYCRAVDRVDAGLLATVFHEDALIEHGKFVGGPAEFASWAAPLHADALSYQHIILNHACELDGATAHAETYFMFVRMNSAGRPLTMNGGRYIDRLERREDDWRIAARVTLRDWAALDHVPDFTDLAALTSTAARLSAAERAFMNAGRGTERGPGDPSYDRPLSVPPSRRADYVALTRKG